MGAPMGNRNASSIGEVRSNPLEVEIVPENLTAP